MFICVKGKKDKIRISLHGVTIYAYDSKLLESNRFCINNAKLQEQAPECGERNFSQEFEKREKEERKSEFWRYASNAGFAVHGYLVPLTK